MIIQTVRGAPLLIPLLKSNERLMNDQVRTVVTRPERRPERADRTTTSYRYGQAPEDILSSQLYSEYDLFPKGGR
jgi:hypothetical protein